VTDRKNRGSVPEGVTRTQFAARNSAFGLVGKAVSLIANFVSRTVFIYILGKYYLGVNGLYTEILSFLSFAELGFGSAMTFALYGPVARGECEKVRELMDFYKKTYRIIAIVILIFGLALTPFLQYIINGAGSLSLFELRLYFLIFLANTVTTYFVIYKYGYLNAMQMTYVTTNIETITSLVCVAVQLIALVLTQSFLVYLLANTATLIISRFIIANYLNSRFPLLAEKPEMPLPKNDRRGILTEVKGLAIHQFSGVAVHATDSIIISAVPTLGVAVVGVISNYNMIINAVSGIVVILFNSVVAGFGNLAVTSDQERFEEVFDESNFANFWIYGFCTACFVVLLTPFIRLWVGGDYAIDSGSLALIILNFYLQGQSTIYNNARIAKGNFNMDKWWSLLQAVVNLVVSVWGAIYLGLIGVYVGTVLSRLVFVISRPCSTYRFLFGESSLHYFRQLTGYLAAVLLATGACWLLCKPLLANLTWVTFIAATAICLAIPNVIFFGIFHNSKEFIALRDRLAGLLRRRAK
jgi:O-antigen/teichoic acid export membrane protein